MTLPAILRVLLLACPGLLMLPAAASPDVRVVGLFQDRAVVEIDGARRVLRAGGAGADGVRLVSADSESAVLEIGGERVTARLDGRVTRVQAPVRSAPVEVYRDAHGMFTTVGAINGLPVPFLIDTGASTVAMNSAQARRLGIDFRVLGDPVTVVTASGNTPGWRVRLERVQLGDIVLNGVPAVVIDGPEPGTTLLGMSFLGRLEINNDGRVMRLRQRY